MNISLPYGDQKISFTVPDENFIGMMDPPLAPACADPEAAIRQALEHPIGCKPPEQIISPEKTIAVIVDDISRPTPVSLILPILLERLEKGGARRENIRIVVALGSHRYMTEQELCDRVGSKIYEQYTVLNSEFRKPEGLCHVGKTPEGADIVMSRCVMEADIHIGVGCLVPHPVMGWGGGGKILYPGVAGEDIVAYFHLKAALIDENMFGKETTPIRDMMEGWVDAVGLDFVVNVILNARFEIADVVAGHYVQAHREGVRRGKKILGYQVKEKADVMIVSSHPADQDFWQSPKAMYAAEAAIKGSRGGTMMLVSPNYEGIGPHAEYPACMGAENGDEKVMACIRGSEQGDPLAIAVGNSMSKLRRRRRLIVVSDGVTREEMESCSCKHYPVSELQCAVDELIEENPKCRIGALSNGAETFLYE